MLFSLYKIFAQIVFVFAVFSIVERIATITIAVQINLVVSSFQCVEAVYFCLGHKKNGKLRLSLIPKTPRNKHLLAPVSLGMELF